MKPSLVLLIAALLAVVPVSALALRSGAGDPLVQAVQVRALRMGDRGEAVAALQRLLKERGYDPGPVDGVFGPLTLAAVEAAQKRHGLEVDGRAGRLTVAALQAESAAGGSETTATTTVAGKPAGSGRRESDLVIYEARPAADQGGSQAALTGPALGETALSADAVPVLANARAGNAPTPVRPVETASGEEGGGEVALTLNGLPDPATLEQILRALAARSMTATFFVTGQQAEEDPELVQRIHEAGHEVASLGYADLDMRQVSSKAAQAQIRRTQRAIAAATGVAPAFFRPPQGRFDRHLTRLVEEEGLTMVLWSNVAVRPVPEISPERLADELVAALYPQSVLMLPLDRPNAVAAIEPLLARMEAKGYRSRNLSALLGAE